MPMSIADQIAEYSRLNPTATTRDIINQFKISRQRVFQVMHSLYSEDEIASRKKAHLNQHSEKIKDMLIEKKTHTEICNQLNISRSFLVRAIKANEELTQISEKNEAEEMDKIRAVSADWINNMTLSDIAIKYKFGDSARTASSYISKLRSRYGEEMFPLRLDNRISLKDKVEQFNALKQAGVGLDEIANRLGYKNAISMKTSFHGLKKAVA